MVLKALYIIKMRIVYDDNMEKSKSAIFANEEYIDTLRTRRTRQKGASRASTSASKGANPVSVLRHNLTELLRTRAHWTNSQ